MQLMEERNALNLLVSQEGTTIEQLYQFVRDIPGTIDQHLDTLLALGRQCFSVLEIGSGMSTIAWLAAGCNVVSIDVEDMPWMVPLQRIVRPLQLTFVHASSLHVAPRLADLLFIDSLHVYDQLRAELALHGAFARCRIVLHDTESFGHAGASLTAHYHPGDRGLMPAVQEWLADRPDWAVEQHYSHQHGLTVLQKSRP